MKMIFGGFFVAADNQRAEVSPAATVPAVVSLRKHLRDIKLLSARLLSPQDTLRRKRSFDLLVFTRSTPFYDLTVTANLESNISPYHYIIRACKCKYTTGTITVLKILP